ncbi:uncharacterized protein LOC117786729 [Drosophila innubila]|uniref:uncharacterized protein LOC117786729 n=1 Tax=Drosophila innubila TaxID=198719 RepID=UPI00148DBC3E|nr:uncharacterized protein LOC117786729 [Drosophila innubila]
MAPVDTYWYLEHPTTGRKIILHAGENTLGRHSTCKFILCSFDFLSRMHVKLIVSHNNSVVVEQLNALNGVFINNIKMVKKTQSLKCGDIIGLGVDMDKKPNAVVPSNHAVFKLKQTCTNADETVLISDDEGDEVGKNFENLQNQEIKQEIRPPDPEPEAIDMEIRSYNENREIHLPKLPDVKQEHISQATKTVQELFGEPDEDFLESALNVNPYVYKQLNNNNNNVNAKKAGKICDGDIIELNDNSTSNNNDLSNVNVNDNGVIIKLNDNATSTYNNLNNANVNETVNSNDNADYDEVMAMSQAVLQEMKEEMADTRNDLSEEDFLSPFKTETDVATRIIDDEIIIIEDDDDELFEKVADWSSRLLSQKVMSPIYGAEGQDAEGQHQSLQAESNLYTRRRFKSLRIEDSDEDVADPGPYPAPCLAVPTTTVELNIKRCRVRLKSIDVSQYQPNTSDPSDANEKSDAMAVESVEPVDPQANSNQLLEVILVPQTTSKPSKSKSKTKTSKTSKRKPEKSSDSPPKELKKSSQKVVSVAKPAETTKRLRDKPKSCYLESPMEVETNDPKPSTRKFISTRSDFFEGIKENGKSLTIEPVDPKSSTTKDVPIPENVPNAKELAKSSPNKTPIAKPVEPFKLNHSRLRNRSKSCYMERPMELETNDPETPTKVVKKSKDLNRGSKPVSEESSRGPKLVTAPHLPVHRGKLRGVSAEQKKETEKNTVRKNEILDKQRTLEYQVEMKKKWYQKPKDKKKEYEENKKMRREHLQKLAEKSKEKSNNSTDTAKGEKRNQLHVPTLGNCNRGEFLTKELQPPVAKKAKLDKETDKKRKTSLKAIPKRRATIECFSQNLDEANPSENWANAGENAPKSPPFYYCRPPERKEAEMARNTRTCNRVTFADMDRDFKYRQDMNKLSKRNRHVRFNDDVQIKYIERIEGAMRKVNNAKDTNKFSLSKYSERREWAQTKGKLENYTDLITGNILSWGNQWLLLGNPSDVAEKDVLMPIPTEFKSYKQYKETIIPLMKLELLTTIEREYKSNSTTFEVTLKSYSRENTRHRPRFLLVTRYSNKPVKKYDLYTLRSSDRLKEIFATLPRMQRIAGNVYELTFEILQKDISMEMLQPVKTLTCRPVVDNMRVELGAFNGVYQLGRSPLFQRILQPSENVISFDSKHFKGAGYRGFKRLNPHQTDICLSTWIRLTDDSTPSITLIQGPPGTGKSAVIYNLALQCTYGTTHLTLDRKILICAHSNAAVDNITFKLNQARNAMGHSKFHLLRFGCFEKMHQSVREVSLEQLLSQEREEKRKRLTPDNVASLLQQQLELIMEIAEIKQRSVQLSYLQQQLQTKEQQLRLVNERLNPPLTPREEYELTKKYIQRANIVCTTLSSCVKLATFIDYFDACIIDEATQCTEPWTLLPLQFGVRGLVLVGDTQQLPATVLSKKAIEFGLGNSMFDRIQRNLKQQLLKEKGNSFVHTKVYKLSMQYRMHPEICRWPNNYFYEGELVNANCTQYLTSPIIPYCVINLSFTRDTNDSSSRSISNDEEARFVAKLLMELDKHMPASKFRYGLITPYSNQCHILSQMIPSHMSITPHTVDAYQGQQRDVIILSNARTRGVGFLTNYQRLNVAITRPRRCLIICGNFDDLKAVDMWRHLLDDARKRQIYFDLKRSDVNELNRSLIKKILVKPIEI